jgi:hypothetical protein
LWRVCRKYFPETFPFSTETTMEITQAMNKPPACPRGLARQIQSATHYVTLTGYHK